ncbi:hypothetical protein GWI33_006924, partial [Rhynchophorus ferrugineus]
MNTED